MTDIPNDQPPSTTSVFTAFYKSLDKANNHIQTILPKQFERLIQAVQHTVLHYPHRSSRANEEARTGARRVAKRVREVCAAVKQQAENTQNILDIMKDTIDIVPPMLDDIEHCVMVDGDGDYTPTVVGETFKYTDVPDSNNFYTAKLVAVRDGGARMDIKHIGADMKYGHCTIKVAEMQFCEWCPSHKRRKLQDGQYADVNVLFVT